MRIIENGSYHTNNTDLHDRGDTVVMCFRESNNRSYYVAVYMLLGEFNAYNPMLYRKFYPCRFFDILKLLYISELE